MSTAVDLESLIKVSMLLDRNRTFIPLSSEKPIYFHVKDVLQLAAIAAKPVNYLRSDIFR